MYGDLIRDHPLIVVVDSFDLLPCLPARILQCATSNVLEGNFRPASKWVVAAGAAG
jgi:hypothetical protein